MNYTGLGPPIIFETMVFDEMDRNATEYFEIQVRYATEAEARAGHLLAVEAVRNNAE